MQPGALELIRDLGEVLRAEGLRWYIFGAQAVVIHGFVRQTADVDVTVEVPEDRLSPLVRRLESAGFKLRIEQDAAAFIARTRVLPMIHLGSRLPLDLVLAGPGPEEGFLERATEVEANEFRFPVISAEDLIVVKVLAGRAKDLEDVRGVLVRKREAIDLEAIRGRLRELELLLDQSDLLPRFEEVLVAARRR
jgi:hypothetical protein